MMYDYAVKEAGWWEGGKERRREGEGERNKRYILYRKGGGEEGEMGKWRGRGFVLVLFPKRNDDDDGDDDGDDGDAHRL
jgi:hypothetical protein